MSTVQVDTINESTTGSGVTVDGVLIKDNAVNTDTITEKTSGSGVTIDGLLIKDSNVTLVSGTWTATIEYSTTLTTTSGFSTTTLTGNYVQIGKWYRCSLPSINRSSMGVSSDFIVYAVSLPATTASTNQTVNGVYGYGLGARYNTTVIGEPQLMAGCGGSATALTVQGLDTDAGGTGFILVSYGTTGFLDLSWDFVAA